MLVWDQVLFVWSLIKSVIPSCCFVQIGEGRMKLFPIRGLSRGFHQVPREITKSKTDGYKEMYLAIWSISTVFSPSYVQAAVTMPKIHGKGVYFLQQRFCQKPKICSSVLLIELSLPILGQFGKINAGKNIHHLQGRFELAMKPCPPQARLSWSTARADSLVTTACAKIFLFSTAGDLVVIAV